MLDFIINPVAGGKNGKKMVKNVAVLMKHMNENKIEYKFHKTQGKGQAILLTEQLIDGGSTDIIVVGGDGTLHEVINGFKNFDKVNMGIIPCGTGNDFATALGIPKDPIKALDLVLKGNAQFTDFMQMPTVRGLNIIGMGIDVDVLKRYDKLKKKNKFGYTSCLIKTLFNFDYVQFNATLNGASADYRSFIACVANGSMYGGGIPICPIADPCDGKLDFVTVDAIKRLAIIPAFIKLKGGKLLSLKQAKHQNMDSVKITCPTPYVVNVDGELYENIPFEVKIVSNTLKIYR